VNSPPSGGSCTACVETSDTATASCINSGQALVDSFRLSCSGWADTNLPLEYQFGFRPSIAGALETWFASSQEDTVELIFGGGNFDVVAVVHS
jgi:hypothetical protein